MLLVSICLILVIVLLLHLIIRKNEAARKFDEIPGPKGIPLFGNVFQFLVSPTALFYKGRELFSQYRSINRVWLLNVRLVNLYDPEHIEAVLSTTKHNDKNVPYKFLRPWLREGLLVSNGDKWHVRRKILTPAFHFNILKQFTSTIEEQSNILVKNLENEIEKEKTDIIPFITQSTLNTICETSMGTSLNDNATTSLSKYFEAIHSLGNYAVYRLVRIWLYSDFIFNLTSIGKRQKETLRYLHDFTMMVIQKRKRLRNSVSTDFTVEVDDDVYCRKKRMALLDLLIEAEKEGKIDDIGIREEVDTFMFEGHDTTAMALCFAIMLLANHKDVQEKIYEECMMVFGDSERQASIENLMELKYLECCIKESLRLYPSVPYIARYLKEELVLDKFTIPANTICNLHIFDIHRNNDLFESALSFKPERFLAENSVKRHPFSYIPFSAGPRNCIGQKFAMLELKSVIAHIILKYKMEAFTKPEDLVLTADIVLRTTHPIYVKFNLR